MEAVTHEVHPDTMYILNNVVLEYGQIESWKLSELTHRELSWRNARKGLGTCGCGRDVLALEDIKKDAEKVRPYDHVWDMFCDEFEDLEEVVQR